jgi:site-specific recombinase XerD
MNTGLIPRLKQAIAEQSCSRRTFHAYRDQALALYRFTGKTASQWTGADVQAWLWSLHQANYSASSRKTALCAAAFIFKHVLKADMGRLELPPMPKVHQTLRTIPSREELGRIFAGLKGQAKLMAALMYGSGLRVGECCTLRVQDLDLAALTVRIHAGKGDKSRLTVLPRLLLDALRRHLAWRAALHDCDLANGHGYVELPGRLAVKYRNAPRELRWQYVFPSTLVRGQYRWHATDESVAKQMRASVRAAGIITRVTPHTLRHAFATHAMQAGNDPRTVQDLLGHESLETTMIYLHGDAARGFSPLDAPSLHLSPSAGSALSAVKISPSLP